MIPGNVREVLVHGQILVRGLPFSVPRIRLEKFGLLLESARPSAADHVSAVAGEQHLTRERRCQHDHEDALRPLSLSRQRFELVLGVLQQKSLAAGLTLPCQFLVHIDLSLRLGDPLCVHLIRTRFRQRRHEEECEDAESNEETDANQQLLTALPDLLKRQGSDTSEQGELDACK